MRTLAALLVLVAPLAARAAASCDAVPVLAADTREVLRGVEDIVIDRDVGIAYLSAYDRWAVEAEVGGPQARTAQGGLYALPLGQTDRPLVAKPLTRDFASANDFHPHGIDLFIAANGARTLFAVNHHFLHEGDGWRTEHTVEVFDVGDAGLTHRLSVTHPFITSPNDLVAVGADAFFVTNDHGGGTALARMVEDVTGRGLGNVVQVDPGRPAAERVRLVAGGIAFANGIALSPDRRTLYVAAARDKALLAFNLASPTQKPRTIPLPLGPDNLSWAPDGTLYVAGHPDLVRFALYAKTANARFGVRKSPSQVIRLDPAAADAASTIESVWRDDGATLSAATVAAVAGNVMLIGTVYADRIGVCRLADDSDRHARR
jgi:arylesterase/paraoxonase